MAITLGFNLASDAKSAAEQFIQMMNANAAATMKMGESIERFNSQGQLISQTFKAIAADGTKLEATLRQTAQGFELIGAKSDSAASSLKELQRQEEAAALAQRRRQANQAEAQLFNLKGLQPGGNTNQINAAEAAMQKIRQAIESGAVSLQRFQQLYNQVVSNPKAIIPNLTQQEQQVVRALRTMQQGFDVTGDKAQRAGEKITISWQGVLRLFEAQVIKRATGALQSALVEGVQSAVDFSVRIAEIQTISQQSGMSTDQWSAGVRRLAASFGANQADVAEAAYQSLSNQVTKAGDTFDFLQTALRFGKATVTSTADSVNLLSSAIKSFNLPTSDAERVASIFFKTIELGRVRGNEMADTFGRVGTIAADAGVKLEEVSAAISTLTVKGMKFSDASTLISNLLLKLIRPTDEMKQLLAEWGVASGQAAIATFGFSGVLQKLDQEAQKGSNRLGELFNQIRAFRGAINLTGGSFADFQENLGKITEGSGEFNKAVDIVMESFGDRVKRQMNQVKVYFSEEFGDGIIQAFVKISESMGGMANILATLEKYLTPVVVGMVGWKAGTIAATAANYLFVASETTKAAAVTTSTVATGANTVAQGTNAAATLAQVTANLRAAIAQNNLTLAQQAGTIATNTLAFAMQNLNVALGAFGIGFTLGMYLFNQDDERRTENIVKNLEKIEGVKFDALKSLDKSTTTFKGDVEETRQAFDNRYKIILQFYSNNVRAADDAKKKAIQNLKEVTEQTKVSSKNYFDAITQGLTRLKEAASEAKSMIDASLKASEGIGRKLGDQIFDARMKYASEGRVDLASGMVVDEQKTALIKARINEITALARSKFKEGTKESVDDARRLYGELEKLTTELFDAETKKRRTQFDEMVKRGQVQPTAVEFDPQTGQMRARYDFTVKTVELENQLKAIAGERLAAEQKLRAEKERQLKAVQDLELRERERVKTIQQAISEIEKIRVLDDKGEPTAKFKDDPRKALAEFDRQAAIARQAASQLEVRDRLQTLDFLGKQREALEREVNARVLADRTRSEQESAQMQRKLVNDRLVDIERSFNAATQRMANEAKKVSVTLQSIGEADFSLSRNWLFGKPTQAGKMVAELRTLQKTALEANEAFAKDKTKANLDANVKALDAFIEKYKEYVRTATGKEINQLPENSPGMLRLKALEAERQALVDAMDAQAKAKADLDKMTQAGEQMKDAIGGIPNVWKLIEQAAGVSTPVITKSIDQIIAKTDELILKAKQAADAIAEMGGAVPNQAGPRPGGYFGGQPRTYAFGGRGSDDQLAYINRKETVMTGEASDNWSPLLRAMNAGLTPTQAVGGNSVTNVGDININMQGSNTPTQNVRTFAKSLRRALRRGIATLE